MKIFSHKSGVVQAQLRAQLLIQPSHLTVIRLTADSQIRVQGATIWLTHSASSTDFVLQCGDQMRLPEGLVLISTVGSTAFHEAQVAVMPMVKPSRWLQAGFWLRRLWRKTSDFELWQAPKCCEGRV